MNPGGKPSLRRRIAQDVLAPLIVTWALGTVVVVAVAEHFAGQAFDRSLLDDAYALASHVHGNGGQLSLTLTDEEMKTLLFDQSESMYFAVLGPNGALVAGRAGLPAALLASSAEHEFADIAFEGRRVRTVTLRSAREEPFIVVMGQTSASRTRLLQRLLGYSVLPQAALLVLLAWWLRRRIEDDLRPLGELEQAIERRHAADLAPLPAQLKTGASTRDVERIAQSIDALFARLGDSVQAQREFAGNVAHELRTPLAGIRAQAAFALARAEPAVWREQLEGIAQAEQRASRLVDQLLALARAGEGRVSMATESIELHTITREALLRFIPRARAAGVDLGAEGLDEPCIARGDRALVEGILNNLLDNALRYGTGAPERHITVALARTAAGVELSVTDNGPGLPEGAADHLTQRWVRGEQGRRAGDGAGLGLAIVSRYAELMESRLAFANAPGGGLRASIVFPP